MENPGASAPLPTEFDASNSLVLSALANKGYDIRIAADPDGAVRVFVGRGL